MKRSAALLLSFLFLIIAAANASTDSVDSVIIQDQTAVGTHAPDHWKLDAAAAEKIGLCALYVTAKSDFNSSPAVIYARIASSGYVGEKGINKLVDESVREYKESSPAFKLETKKDFKSRNGFTFKIRYFLNGPSPNNFEAVGYMPFKEHITIAVFSAKTKKAFDEHENSFYGFLEKVSPYSSNLSPLSGSCLRPAK